MEIGFDGIGSVFSEVTHVVAGPDTRIWPYYLTVTILIAFFVYLYRRIDQPFLTWLLPKSVYFHPSHIVDLKVFCINRLFLALGLFNMVFLSAYVADSLAGGIGPMLRLDPFSPILISLLLLAAGDFGTYWVHRIHHENSILWPLHALHHSAEVMTPITVYRKHPLYDVISTFVKALLIGAVQGLFLAFFTQDPSFMTVAGVNAGYVLFNVAGSNLRHTHIWLSFGPVLEHLFISPAQHQIHHSLAPKHHNKNYGEVLAIWDWMFGTLYVPCSHETLEFGLADSAGNRLQQPHDSLANSMFIPLRDSGLQLARLVGLRQPAQPAKAEATRPQDTTLAE
ncbi:sterol desaturase family protein [Magnetovibrio blakemorei]|uniref:Fatty acid hydroxylase domain-containing protein n=1 Tax=Magnetovibrio blakemorei TaxID=28181 RepID=A0A1E5Q9M7_9PROT|nr:sterol desaturase family protein [Magnetovibrio blakemorei]OEJ68395.1 hypothetical protein BEN30_06455 [Magnetovibrio blakemorei]